MSSNDGTTNSDGSQEEEGGGCFKDWSVLRDSVEGQKEIQSVSLHIVLPVSSASSFSSSDSDKMPGGKICERQFSVLRCFGSTAASALLWVFSPGILKHLVSRLVLGPVFVSAHLRQPLNRHLASSSLLCFFTVGWENGPDILSHCR